MRTYELNVHHWVAAVVVLCTYHTMTIEAAEKNSSYKAALESITTGELRTHVAYLADDALEGREAGKPGNREAADYLVEKLRQLGLEPGGTDGGYFQPFEPNYRNILALLPGSDPKLKHEVIILGAHYDHVGYGTEENSHGPYGVIHNGADDNASGTSGLLELAEAFTMLPEAPRRSILFAFWDAEEMGMFGSKHWVDHPTIPLDLVATMVNLDMIGRLRENRLAVLASRTAYGWRRLVSQHNDGPDLALDFSWSLEEWSDHTTFIEKDIPVLLLSTGEHEDYHRPSDDAHLIDHDGLNRIVRLTFGLVNDLADRTESLRFRPAAREETEKMQKELAARVPRLLDRFGASWQQQQSQGGGVRLTRVVYNEPASRSKLRSGDRIVQFAGHEIVTGDDLTGAITAAESPVTAVVYRSGRREPQELTVELTGKPMRLGIAWRQDDAEPGAIILTSVVPGSAAARAGLQLGDRVYQAAGQDFTDDGQFVQLATGSDESLTLLVERDGRIQTVVLQFTDYPTKKAA